MTKLIHVLTIWSLFISQMAFAVDIKLTKTARLRKLGADGLIAVTMLPKGTIVQIPDEYVTKHLKGKTKDEVALLNWLQKGGNLSPFVLSNGEVKHDFFFPVKVISTPNGKKIDNYEGQIALRHLAKENGLQFVTVKDAQLYESHDKVVKTISTSDCNTCSTKTDGESLYEDIRNKLSDIFSKIEEGTERTVESKSSTKAFIKNFEATCNMKFGPFLDKLMAKARDNNIPPEILLGMMSVESEGKCDAYHKDEDGTISYGLFQVNTGSTKINMSKLKDPIVNMDESVRILIEKYKLVNNKKTPKKTIAVDLLTSDELSLWKKALSAYNGGEAHVYQSHNDLNNLNKRYDLGLDPNDWQDRRPFYFRKEIEKNTEAKFSNKHKYKRSETNAINNLIYVESILGTKKENLDDSLSIIWQKEIKNELDRRRSEDERKKLEEERKRLEEEKKRLEEEQRKEEEKIQRLEEERKKAEEDARRKAEEARKRLEEEKKRLEEEKQKQEAERQRLEAEQRKRDEELRKKKEEEELVRKKVEELIAKRQREADEARQREEQKKDAILNLMTDYNSDSENKVSEAEESYKKQMEEYEKLKRERELAEQRERERLEKERIERERLAELERKRTEADRLNASGADYLENRSGRFWRTTILGVPRLAYRHKVRNTHPFLTQKCTIFIISRNNNVNDIDKHEITIRPGENITLTGTLKKPWVNQGGTIEKECEFLPYSENK